MKSISQTVNVWPFSWRERALVFGLVDR